MLQEWYAAVGGSEQVADEFARLLPSARVACLWNDTPGRYGDRPINESWLARTPLRKRKAAALPLMPLAWDFLVRSDDDYVLASSHLFAHHAGHRLSIPRLAYVHSPARYLWSPEIDSRGASPLIRAAAAPWKALDRKRASGLTAIAANSSSVRLRIEKYWGRDAVVIYPPVDTEYFGSTTTLESSISDFELERLHSLPSGFYLGASRFVAYKRLDILIRAAALFHEPVVLAGSGPEKDNLMQLGRDLGVPLYVFDAPTRPVLRWLMASARALVFPGLEDFGIIPVEAMATGTPVVARRQGGTAETITDGVSGALVEGDSPRQWAQAMSDATLLHPEDCRAQANRFSHAMFDRNAGAWLRSYVSI